jgi:porin
VKAPLSPQPYDPRTSQTLTGNWAGLRTDLENLGLTFRLFYNQQAQQNFHGGLRQDHGRLSGSYDLQVELNFEKMGLFKGGGFFMEASGTWNEGINPSKVGALFNVNADACGDYPIFVKKWWFKQSLLDQKIELRLGLLETNKDLFDVGLYANHEDKDFLNQISIRNPTIPHRKGLGAFVKVKPVDWFYFQAAAVDAQSRPRRTGFDTAFHDEAWFIGMWEAGFTPAWPTERGPLPGRYRIGWWYDRTVKTIFRDTLDGALPVDQRGNDLGFYLGFDQMVWKENANSKDTQGLGLFARYGTSHGDVNKVNNVWEVGASYKGLIPARDQDVTALAVSEGILSEQYRHEQDARADRETVYEWYYALQLTPWCIVSPDVQVVTNPGGNKGTPDAFVGGVRVRIVF